MPYCFLPYVQARDGHGLTPDCPDGLNCLLLADVQGLGWGIFDVEINEDWSPAQLVSDALARLIESAKRYPPALALARDEMSEVFDGHRPDQPQFARAYATSLRTHLSRQHEAPYVLAAAQRDKPAGLAEGEWYWVLEVSGSPAVASWVSDDFHVYKTDMHDFDLTGQQLKRLGYVG